MGLETALILFGIIGQAVSESETSSLEVAAETSLTIGLIMVAVELLVVLVLFLRS